MKSLLSIFAFICVIALNTAFAQQRDQVFTDDVIIQASECVGIDCINGEDFGATTIRLKENNLRIEFFDTSSSGTFPYNDWELGANESANGGLNCFYINDNTNVKRPFLIEANAPQNAFYLSSSGNLGLGTNTPARGLHIVAGDSPSIRLEQNTTFGWPAQTWEIVGNETNFFVRDLTNMKLTFKIRGGAPENSIYVNTNGDIGLGTNGPGSSLHIRKTNNVTPTIRLENYFGQQWEFSGSNQDFSLIDVNNTDTVFNLEAGAPANSIYVGSTGRVGLQTDNPEASLHIVSTDTYIMNLETDYFGDIFKWKFKAGPTFEIYDADSNYTPVSISKGSPNYSLSIADDGRIGLGGPNTTADKLFVNGTASIGGDLNVLSDKRIKKNIQGIPYGLQTIKELKPVSFEYDNSKYPELDLAKGTQFGLIAQEVEEVIPELISSGYTIDQEHNEQLKNVNYIELIPVLVMAIQEQQEIIDDMDYQLKTLQAQIDSRDHAIIEIKNELIELQRVVSILKERSFTDFTPEPVNQPKVSQEEINNGR